MELKLYDTLTKEKRPFRPLDPKNVRVYVCGPTVYDFAHIGNARPVIVFDVLFRLLRHVYGPDHVTYVRNITDVDDKINDRAARDYPGLALNDAIRKVTEKTANQFHTDVAALGCLPPTHEPRATEYIADMTALIQTLLDKDHAYVAIGSEGKEVFFNVASAPDYGALSGRNLEDQKAGARVAVDAHKINPGDFVLWKESGAKQPGWQGEFEFVPHPNSGWDAEFKISPENARRLRGNSLFVSIHGRPGWHIECSAMSAAYLGKVFDIHGGGLDLIFPHHENEIAQSRCAHDTPSMANYWMHNGFVQIEGEKMSKSLGNFFTINELLEDWPGDVLRLQMLLTNYRSPIDWTENNRLLAQSELEEWAESLHSYFNYPNEEQPNEVVEALCDDLNTSAAITALRELHVAAKKGGHKEMQKLAANLKFLGFQKLDKPGLFRTGISALNVGGIAIGKYEPAIRRLRAATANGAPNEILSSISSTLVADGLGIDERKSGDMILVRGSVDETESRIQALVASRLAARAQKDFKRSDEIRDELAKMGVSIKDGKDADGKPVTTWEIAR